MSDPLWTPATVVAACGVVVAGLGLWITVPAGFNELGRRGRERAREARELARRLLARLPWVDDPTKGVTLEVSAATSGAFAASASVSVSASGSSWSPGTSAHERVERLHGMHLQLARRVSDLDRQLREVVAEQVNEERAARVEAIAELRRQLDELAQALRAAEQAQVEVDALGVPVVLLGLVLTGIPRLVAFAGWASAVPLALVAVVVAVASARAARQRHADT